MRGKLGINSCAAVVALHKFIFESEGDRGNRQHLREFDVFADNDVNKVQGQEEVC